MQTRVGTKRNGTERNETKRKTHRAAPTLVNQAILAINADIVSAVLCIWARYVYEMISR